MKPAQHSAGNKPIPIAWLLAALIGDLLLLCLVIGAAGLRAGLLGGLLVALGIAQTPTTFLPTPSPPPTATPLPRPSLRSLAEANGLLVGVSVGAGWLSDPTYANLLTSEFNAVTAENAMKFESLHPGPQEYSFEESDAIVDFASQNGMKVRGHTLVWGNQLPEWVLEGEYSREEWIEILRQHINTVVGRYRDTQSSALEGQGKTVIAWDVVNEAIGEKGELLDNFWLQKIGPSYIPLAFQFAHEADPQALLFYNDNGGEGLNPKSQGIYNLVQGLVKASVPIDGVGFQLHVGLDGVPSAGELVANMKRLADLGLVVHITEMDVRTQYRSDPLPQKLEAQAGVYRQVVEACLQSPNCQGFFTWGLTDSHSWIPGLTGKEDFPLLFDQQYQPKPALFALLDLLKSMNNP